MAGRRDGPGDDGGPGWLDMLALEALVRAAWMAGWDASRGLAPDVGTIRTLAEDLGHPPGRVDALLDGLLDGGRRRDGSVVLAPDEWTELRMMLPELMGTRAKSVTWCCLCGAEARDLKPIRHLTDCLGMRLWRTLGG